MKPVTLVVIDIRREYLTHGRPFYIEGIAPSLANAKRVLETARAHGWRVIHVKHLQDGEIFSPQNEYSEFAPGFEPRAGEAVVTKGNYSSYSSEAFRELASIGSDEMIVVGYGSTMCCPSTIVDGYHRGHRYTFVSDASAAKRAGELSEDSLHTHATEILRRFATVKTTAEILAQEV